MGGLARLPGAGGGHLAVRRVTGLRGQPHRRHRLRQAAGRRGERAVRAARPDPVGAGVLREQPAPRPHPQGGDRRPRPGERRRGRTARRPVRRHLRRPPPGPVGPGEHRAGRTRTARPGRVRGRARGADHHRELRDGGLAPGRLPGQPRLLPRAVGVDVRPGPLPQLRPLAPAVAGHRPGGRAAPLRRPHPARPGQGRPAGPAGQGPLRRLRPHRRARRRVGQRLVALPGAGARRCGLAPDRGHPLRGRLHRGAVRGARGPRMERGHHQDHPGSRDRTPHAAPAHRGLTPRPPAQLRKLPPHADRHAAPPGRTRTARTAPAAFQEASFRWPSP
ncbi:Inosose isomerase [Actinacidiphila bryophytorum]|uniref:Inosose isomerase n=1 Tax=Actinacidiphila bryophytorum TaxID=1436133 RepID=A0A9W4MH53_9ACTN|nr:Inosose isomerase [Actinacidiphila bryophytorum]